MKIYSLSGPSGTGKSTSALQFAHDHNIEAIIDDGLLIIGGTKVAGTSAKFEKNTMTAVKRAIFAEDAHCEEVKEAITNNPIQSLLIIGTSKKMTKHIAQRLELENIDYFYDIEQVRSDREIKMAQFIRSTQGKHVMPIPYKQVQQNFFKRLIQKGVDIFSAKKEKIGETTIVFPDFHQETIHISRAVYISLIKYTVQQFAEVRKVDKVVFIMERQLPVVEVDVTIKAPVTYNIVDKMTNLQKAIDDVFLHHFGIHTGKIVVLVKGIDMQH